MSSEKADQPLGESLGTSGAAMLAEVGLRTLTNDQFNLGKLVGEHLALITERKRIIELIENLQLTTIDPVTQEVQEIEMDWGPLFDQINNPEEE